MQDDMIIILFPGNYIINMSQNSIREYQHDLLGSLLDDEEESFSSHKPALTQTRTQVSSAPPALFDLGFKFSDAFLENQDFDSPDPEDLSIKEAFTRKQPPKYNTQNQVHHISQMHGYRKMSCDIEMLSYYENSPAIQFGYYQYQQLSPEDELMNNLGQVSQWAKDQNGSRTVQSIFESENEERKDAIFHAIFKDAINLIKDRFGNYVFQKIFEKGLQNHKNILRNTLWGNIVNLSVHPYGCRVIQKAIECQNNEQIQEKFMEEIMTCPLYLIQNQNGNHVIQKCFEIFPHQRVLELAAILSTNLQNLSFHAYGCRVIQKYLENYREQAQCQQILEKLLKMAIPLSQCQYGNYVMQHIVTKCFEERKKIFDDFIGHIVDLSTNKYASNVIEKAIQAEGTQFCNKLADWFSNNTNELIFLSKHQFGNYVVQSMLNKTTKERKMAIKNILKENASEISNSQFGRHVLLQLQKIRNK